MMATGNPGKWTQRIARASIAAAILVVLAGPLIKFGILPWAAGLGMFAIGAILAGLGGIFCLVRLLKRQGGIVTVVGAAAGLAALAVPVAIVVEAGDKPPIHDITTDTANPPAFVTITPALRGADSNPVSYDPALAPVQAKAYPKVKPLVIVDEPRIAFEKALAAVTAMGWTLVDKDAYSGRIEATDTVPWWGFKDDVVIRLTPEGNGTRIDVRSKSRVGKGDLGVNAERIGKYLAKISG
ncbi:MAG: DUF1499 domain-containing protein [Polymorphobacter sp.]